MKSGKSLYLAPLQGFTNVFYRKALTLASSQVNKYFTPFFEQGKNTFLDPHEFPELDLRLNSGLNVVPQVATNSPDFFVQFADHVLKLGYSEINLNMGCPFPMLVKRQKGGGLLQYPNMADALISALFEAHPPIQLSVKMRAGLADVREGQEMMSVLNKYPLNEVIIHPRLVTQIYNGEPDWNVFQEMQEACVHPVIGNGDINSRDDWQMLSQRFPDVAGWMIGRGGLRLPVLWDQISGKDKGGLVEFLKVLHYHYFELVTSYYSDWYRSFNYLYSFWKYPLEGVENGKRFFRKLKKHNTPESYQEWLNKLWDFYDAD
ncbi:MAG: tRNA-dihydrouridine synthase family protein [Marinilabiliaceae bacterium]|nr:tRNA-dihydrouridine synthase family protein [Marinilabiliaceae bacterium]